MSMFFDNIGGYFMKIECFACKGERPMGDKYCKKCPLIGIDKLIKKKADLLNQNGLLGDMFDLKDKIVSLLSF